MGLWVDAIALLPIFQTPAPPLGKQGIFGLYMPRIPGPNVVTEKTMPYRPDLPTNNIPKTEKCESMCGTSKLG